MSASFRKDSLQNGVIRIEIVSTEQRDRWKVGNEIGGVHKQKQY
jgi:hypothetical protein